MSSEIPFTRRVCEEMTEAGAFVIPYVASSHASGIPDRMVVHRQWSGWLEFKGVTTPVKKRQSLMMKQMHARDPGIVFIVREGEGGDHGTLEDVWEMTIGEFDTGRELIELLVKRAKLAREGLP